MTHDLLKDPNECAWCYVLRTRPGIDAERLPRWHAEETNAAIAKATA